jgi:hypothetical protein
LSPGRLSLSHDHDACDLVLGVKHETVIQVGEDAFEPFLQGQVRKGYGDLLLEEVFISSKPDAGLLLDVPCHFQQGSVSEVHREHAVLDGDTVRCLSPRKSEQTESQQHNQEPRK